jgi:hypothetical protein
MTCLDLRYGLRASPGSHAAEIPLANEEAFHGARPMGPYSRPDRERKNTTRFSVGAGQIGFAAFFLRSQMRSSNPLPTPILAA